MFRAFRALPLFLLFPLLSAGPGAGQFLEPDAEVIHLLEGNQTGDYFGWLAANLGDLDGDGIDDSAVSAIAFDGFAGRVAVVSGASGALLHEQVGSVGAALGYALDAAGDVDGDGTPDYIAGGGQVLVISGSDHQVLFDFAAVTGFSDSVGGRIDLNDDGFDDLLVGTSAAAVTGEAAGRVWAFSGFDGSLLWTHDGLTAGDQLGSAVGGLDDVDGDGTPDVVAGASGAGPSQGGEALVLSGSDGSLIHTLRPADETDARVFGSFFASGSGDLDGDGVGDIFVGDLDATVEGQASTGAAYVFSGRTGFPIHVLPGLEPGEGFGLGRAIPDVNGDHRPDLLIGAFNNGEGAASGGATYLFSGRSGALLRRWTSTTASDNFGGDAIGTGDVDGDGLPDFLVTAPGLSFVNLDAGRAFVLGGSVLPCPADLTGNGRVDLRDLWRFKRARRWQSETADLNGDGRVDLADLIVLVRDWGRCAPGFPSP